jgi:hypothetical protein
MRFLLSYDKDWVEKYLFCEYNLFFCGKDELIALIYMLPVAVAVARLLPTILA